MWPISISSESTLSLLLESANLSYVIFVIVTVSPSGSVASIVPMAVWFSAILKVTLEELNCGPASFILVTFTVIAWSTELVPSVAVTVAV